jgi:hypothetical protein
VTAGVHLGGWERGVVNDGAGTETKESPRLSFLTFDPATSQSIRFGPFFDAPRDLGCVDRDTIAISYLSADRHR